MNSLYIDGFKQPAGTYSAAELPAFIEGSGSVTIVEVHPPSVPEISITRNNTSVTSPLDRRLRRPPGIHQPHHMD